MASPVTPSSDEFEIVGLGRTPLADAYHAWLRAPCWASIGALVVAYLLLNVAFGGLYVLVGGIEGGGDTLLDAFFFSVQTMGTIGYGTMHPVTAAANVLVTVEAVIGLLVTAISTGLVFARISQPRARIAFSEQISIAPMDGVPTLQVRVGNQRANLVVNAQIIVGLVRTEVTREGVTFYRMYDLPLVRERAMTLTRTWTVQHRITPGSPLWGATPGSLAAAEVEIQVSVLGTDDTTLQPVHAGIRYHHRDVRFGVRPADVLSELPDGRIRVDLRRFHELVPADGADWTAALPERAPQGG